MATDPVFRAGVQQIANVVGDLGAFPVAFSADGRAASPTSTPAGFDQAAAADDAIAEVLRWTPKTGQPKEFAAALETSFEAVNRGWFTEYAWRPRGFSSRVDEATATGPRAVVARQVRVVLDEIKRLVAELKPIRPDADAEDTESIRKVLVDEVEHIADEIAAEAGPMASRVDLRFARLLNGGRFPYAVRQALAADAAFFPACVLLRLADQFGMSNDRARTVEEEATYTAFLGIVNYVLVLQTIWVFRRNDLQPTTSTYLGVQQAELARLMNVVVESLDEVEEALDRVYIRAAEREVAELVMNVPLGLGQQERFPLGQLLDAVRTFATIDGPALLRDAGRDGAGEFFLACGWLADRVAAAKVVGWGVWPNVGQQNPASPRPGYGRPLVQNALLELEGHLIQARNQAFRAS